MVLFWLNTMIRYGDSCWIRAFLRILPFASLVFVASPSYVYGFHVQNCRYTASSSRVTSSHRPITTKILKSRAHHHYSINQKSMPCHRHRYHHATCTHAATSSSTTNLDEIYKNIQNIQSSLVPAIPLQKEPPQTFWKHFQLRFMIKEFLIGVQYMCKLHWLLILGSMLGRLWMFKSGLVDYTNLERILIELGPRPSISLYHGMENFVKVWMLRIFQPSQQVFFYGIVPLLEEIANRGVAQTIYRLVCRGDLWVLAWLSYTKYQFLSISYLSWSILSGIMDTYFIMQSSSDLWLSHKLIMSGLDWVGYTLFLPARFQLWKRAKTAFKKNNQQLKWEDICNMDSSYDERLSKDDDNRGEEDEQGGSPKTAAPGNDKIIRQSTSRSTRWYSSVAFGIAHYESSIPENVVSPFRMCISAQKCFGTFLSSFLIESRLAINRGTIWGCIGAHAAYNFFVSSFPSLTLLRMGLPPVLCSNLSLHDLLISFGVLFATHAVIQNLIVKALDQILERNFGSVS